MYAVTAVLAVAIGIMGLLFRTTLDQSEEKYDKVLNVVVEHQVSACERGNVIRAQLREDNEITIESLRRLILTGAPAEKAAHQKSLEDRLKRRQILIPFPCELLRDPKAIIVDLET